MQVRKIKDGLSRPVFFANTLPLKLDLNPHVYWDNKKTRLALISNRIGKLMKC